VDERILAITSANSCPLSAPFPNAFKVPPNKFAVSSAVEFKAILKSFIGLIKSFTSSLDLPKLNKVVASFATSFDVLTELPATFKISVLTSFKFFLANPEISGFCAFVY
jgi:hypothetical protein